MLSIFYWIFLVLALLVGGWAWWPTSRQSVGAWVLVLLLFVIIGIRLFPVPLH
jgi:hypothetical protein